MQTLTRADEHILQVFAQRPRGTFLTIDEIVATETPTYPESGERPNPKYVQGRLWRNHTLRSDDGCVTVRPELKDPSDHTSKKGGRRA